MTWSSHVTSTAVVHQLSLQTPVPFTTDGGQALDATVWHAMQTSGVSIHSFSTSREEFIVSQTRNVTYMADSDVNCRGSFAINGTLANTVNAPPKVINECVTTLRTMAMRAALTAA